MMRVYQTIQGQTITGDCFRCCIASILELPVEDVPHFYANASVGDMLTQEQIDLIDGWFIQRDMRYIELSMPTRATCLNFGMIYPNLHYLIGGMSFGGCMHTVVARDGQIVHNPASEERSPDVLPYPAPDGKYRIGIIAKNL